MTPTDWCACLDHYFKFPQVNKVFSMVMKEEASVECSVDKERVLTAWRWMLLHEAQLEDKMDLILAKNDLELYHRVKVMEMAKIEDQLNDEFSIT